jgi:MFS family permease
LLNPINLSISNSIQLRKRNDKLIAIASAVISFLTYTMVYGFRKGFTVCSFEGMQFWGLSYKVWLVISQVLGYACSKFYGIRFISELKKIGRGKIILLLVSISWAGLLFFALVPAPWNIVFMFINGFPLGIIWGIIFSYVEGRRATDFIGAALSVSFIFSSGFVKTVAGFILQKFNTSEFWLPFVTGFVFSIPLLIAVYFLEKIPPPSALDVSDRSIREPMPAEKRKEFVKMFLPGLIASIGIYVFATVFRDLRDNFMADMLRENGYGMQPALFTKTETPVTIILLVLMSSMILVRNNIKALIYTHYIIIAGFIITGITSIMFIQGSMSAIWWLTLTGLGLYTVYIPFNCIFFERLIASFRFPGNVGFLIYVADSFGYIGSVGVLIAKEVLKVKLQWTTFYSHGVVLLSVLGIAGAILSLVYFAAKYKRQTKVEKNELLFTNKIQFE